jgi:hypothetical protein
MAKVRVVHLVWAPLGPDPLRRFVASYRRHPAGADHRLHVVFKQFGSPEALAPARAELDGLDYDEEHMPAKRLDLPAYGDVAQRTAEERIFLCNSNTELLADDWLGKLDAALDEPGVGLVAATGSWESGLSPVPLPYKPWRALRFGPFPSPHLRTNALLAPTALAASLRFGPARTKGQAWAIENGRHSLSRQAAALGLDMRVVDRDGRSLASPDWPASRTFRSGDQERLLVADNRTRDYADADPARRRYLAEIAWGPEMVV